MTKWVYAFGGGAAEGSAVLRDLLGGKGANLAEMSSLGLPVPPGFTLTTEVCNAYTSDNKAYPEGLGAEVAAALARVEELVGARFGDARSRIVIGRPFMISNNSKKSCCCMGRILSSARRRSSALCQGMGCESPR